MNAFVSEIVRPPPDPSGPVEATWVHPTVVRQAAFDMYSTVVAAQWQSPSLTVPELGHAHGEALIAGIGNLVGRLTDACCANTLRITVDVGATVEATIVADGSGG